MEVSERTRTFNRESTIECRSWSDFEIVEITMTKVRIRYRWEANLDTDGEEEVESPVHDNL